MKKMNFSWDPKTGSSLCIIQTKHKTYYGYALCSIEDRDMMNEKTGCFIAEKRAMIKMLRDERDELKIEFKALKKYLSSMIYSKYFDTTSYPIRRLQRQMQDLLKQIDETKKSLKEEENSLTQYIQQKTEFYKKIRANRKAQEEKDKN